MKAYGLAKIIREDFGVKTHVTEDYDGTTVVEIHSNLAPDQLAKLDKAIDEIGWLRWYRYLHGAGGMLILYEPDDEVPVAPTVAELPGD